MGTIRHVFGSALLALLLAATPRGADAQAYYAPGAPPPPQYEVVPAPHHSAMIWNPGHWHWEHGRWVWIGGHYVERPHQRAEWVPGHWVDRHHHWEWVPAHWR